MFPENCAKRATSENFELNYIGKIAATKAAIQFTPFFIKDNILNPAAHSIPMQANQIAKNHSVAAIPIQTAIKSSGIGARNTAKQKAGLPEKFGKRK